MNRSRKVAAVFDELCGVMGRGNAQSDLLRLADHVVAMTHADYISPAANDREYGTPFENWAVDTVFADGGWRLLSRNDTAMSLSDQEEAKEVRTHQGMIRYLEEYR